MSFEDQMAALDQWARINRTDCQLGGAFEQAEKFDWVCRTVDLVRSLRELVAKHEEAVRAFESEIARLESLVHRG